MFVIAEIGINHNGDMTICKDLIDVAVDAGCDAVKFQKRNIDKVYTKDFLDSSRESPWGNTQREQKAGLEFGFNEYKIGLPMFPTVFTLKFAVFKIFSNSLQVVDFPFVPVIEIIDASLLISKKRSKSVIILFIFFFK